MFSMALTTLFLPFLPPLAKQILLNNFLADVPSIFISTDSVDEAQVGKVERWNVAEVRHFMIVFGILSSVFDMATFAILLKVFNLGQAGFQTAWYVEPLLTEVVVVLVLRTREPAWRSRPSNPLLLATISIIGIAIAILYVPKFTKLFGFVPLSLPLVGTMLAIVLAYGLVIELAKHWFYKRN
jgi:P-type Mg2+ transporter